MSTRPTPGTVEWRKAPAVHVRAVIARALLEHSPVALSLGDVDLATHQREAVVRLRSMLTQDGGALLADAVGLGKTYVALAIARDARQPLIVAPAALRGMWATALARAAVPATVVSMERLSRGDPMVPPPDLVVVDEAHHFRNPATRRHATLARLTQRARVLLLTATPIHNATRELSALLSLFLGGAAYALASSDVARHIVRRQKVPHASWEAAASRNIGAHPRVEAVRWIDLAPENELLEAIASLPPPVPPSDGDDGGALLLVSLLRQWASSHGALTAALRRRLARAAALIAALEESRHPTRSELRAWRYADEALQLAFPALVSATVAPDIAAMLGRTREHESAVRALLRRVQRADVAGSDPRSSEATDRAPDAQFSADAERAVRLWDLHAAHPGEKIVAFSQFADTVEALFRRLRTRPGVAALAGRGARVAGGLISRGEALRRFAPRASGSRPPAGSDRIDLLLATDLLSEGVNLQDASVVVHLDLPWTPARLEQRVGRAARPGGARDRIAVYAFAPPASAERVLAVERRLREKMATAARALGASGVILPSLLGRVDPPDPSPLELTEEIRSRLARWLAAALQAEAEVSAAMPPGDGPFGTSAHPSIPVGTVRAGREGALALVHDGERPHLLVLHEGGVTDAPASIVAVMALAEQADVVAGPRGVERDVDETRRVECAIHRLVQWLARREAVGTAAVRAVHGERARAVVLRRTAAVLARAPAHSRARLASLAVAVRHAATLPLGAGAERVLRELAAAEMPDEAWLRMLGEFASLQGRPSAGARDRGEAGDARASRILALLLLAP